MSLLKLAVSRRVLNTSASASWRTMATIAPGATPSASAQASPPLSTDPQSSLRPHHNVQINPDHGLWAFFRKDKFGKPVAMEPAHKSLDFSGRHWHAVELRRKSFKDLHTLWYVCLRERNLLATQRAEFRRQHVGMDGLTNLMDKDKRVRKTMKHIKLVLNERRLAYAQAKELWEQSNPPTASETTLLQEPVTTSI